MPALTLDTLTSSAYRVPRPMGISAAAFAQRLIQVKKHQETLLPDQEAVIFYGLGQMVAHLETVATPNQLLNDVSREVVSSYVYEMGRQFRHLCWYLFLICSREFRHLKNSESHLKAPLVQAAGLPELFGSLSDSADEHTLNNWLKKVPDVPLATYLTGLEYGFRHGTWNKGYGGVAWAEVVSVLRRYAAGECSAEVLVDTTYTLAHNNGPIFNKDMIYKNYTSVFKQILDVQRSGQICESLVQGKWGGAIPTMVPVGVNGTALIAILTRFRGTYPGVIGNAVDMVAVEKHGALHTPKKAVGESAFPIPKLKPKDANTLWDGSTLNSKVTFDGKPATVSGAYEYFPGQFVTQVTRD